MTYKATHDEIQTALYAVSPDFRRAVDEGQAALDAEQPVTPSEAVLKALDAEQPETPSEAVQKASSDGVSWLPGDDA